MVKVDLMSSDSGNRMNIEFVESLDIYMKENYRSKSELQSIFLHNWKDGFSTYQDIGNYGRSHNFGGKTIISGVYKLSLRCILDLKQEMLRQKFDI